MLTGLQRITSEGRVNLGLFTPAAGNASVSCSYALVADRGLGLELEDDSGRIRRLERPVRSQPMAPRPVGRGRRCAGRRAADPAACWWTTGNSRVFCRSGSCGDARTIAQETVLSAQVSRRWVDLLERATFAVRHGVVSSLEIRVPAEHRGPVGAAREGAGRPRRAGSRSRWCQAVPAVVCPAGRRQGDGSLSLSPSACAGPRRQDRARNHDPRDLIQGRIAGADEGRDVAHAGDRSEGDGQGVGPFGRTKLESNRPARAPDCRSRSEIRVRGSLPFTFNALALEPVPLPFVRGAAALAQDGFRRRRLDQEQRLVLGRVARARFSVCSPEGARWIGAGWTAGWPSKSTMIRRASATGCGFPARSARSPSWSSSSIS